MSSARIWISSLVWLSILWLVPSQGFSLGIGGIKVKSSLNEPLNASVAVRISGHEKFRPQDLRVSLASPKTHALAGLPYPSVLRNARFDVLQSSSGSVYVLINTPKPIQEPLINLLLKVRWDSGQLVKEISIFLDPPSYHKLPTIKRPARPTTVIASAPVSELNAQLVEHAIPFDETLPVFVEVPANMTLESHPVTRYETRPRHTSKPRKSRRIEIIDGQYGPVRSGDTLNRIARAAAKGTGLTEKEMAEAIYAANPEAFSGSINRLEKGSTLVIPSVTTTEASPRTAVTTDISSIHDLMNDLPSESYVERGKSIPAVNRQGPGSVLEILPPDEASSRIARAMSEEYQRETEALAADVKKSAAAKSGGNVANRSQENDPEDRAIASTGALSDDLKKAASTSTELKSGSDTSNEPAEDNIKNELAETKQALASTQEQLKRLTLQIESLSQIQNSHPQGTGSGMDLILKWLPWLLLVLAAPLLIFFGFRKRQPVEYITQQQSIPAQNLSETRDDDVLHHNDVVASEYADSLFDETQKPVTETEPAADNFSSDTQSLDHPEEFAETAWDTLATDDLQPSSSDTQETIRPPVFGASKATQVIGQDDVLDETDAGLDSAQEAEIYLAYGQLSLAERTISKLIASHPDNDRYRLLELKLFAETGRMSDLQNLSVNLLGKYPDPDSGVNQQVRNICDKAFRKQSQMDPVASPDPSHNQEALESTSETVSAQHVQAEASSDTLEEPTTQGTAEALYDDDISDYLHDDALSELSDDDPLVESFKNFDDATDPETEDTFDSLNDEELGDITSELELEPPIDTLELGEQLDETYADPKMENFSDTDYRLNPLGRNLLAEKNREPTHQKSDLIDHLELPFDLESEIEKLSKR